MNLVKGSYKIESAIVSPSTVGGYNIAGNADIKNSIVFNLTKKPNWFNRFFVKLFLGWIWIDKK